MRVLGLDPGLAIVGFGVIEATRDRAPHLIDFGTIQTPKQASLGDRLKIVHADIHALVDRYQPAIASMEKLFFYRMGNLIDVAQARGAILLALAECGVPLREFSPPQIKQSLTGYGSAKKPEVQAAVARELQLTAIPRPDDAADALAIALTCWLFGALPDAPSNAT